MLFLEVLFGSNSGFLCEVAHCGRDLIAILWSSVWK